MAAKEDMIVEVPVETIVPEAVAVAVGREKSSFQAFKWALKNPMTSNAQTLHLIHVQHPLRFISTGLGPLPFDQANEQSKRQARLEQSAKTEKFLKPYKMICEKQKVDLNVHCIENDSIEKAVADEISRLGISKLVVGSSSGSTMKRLLKRSRISTAIARISPEFCTVIVVRRGRIVSVKDANKTFISRSSGAFFAQSSRSSESITCTNEETDSGYGSYTSSGSSSMQFRSLSPSIDFNTISYGSRQGLAGDGVFSAKEPELIEKALEHVQPDDVSGLTLESLTLEARASLDPIEVFDESETVSEEVAAILLQMRDEIRKRGELCAKLNKALRITKENTIKALTKEIKKREEVSSALSEVRQEADTYRNETEIEKRKFNEALSYIDKLKRELDQEIRLRKNAEKRCLLAEQAVTRLMRQKQMKCTLYTFEKLQEATNNFSDAKKLGCGGYGNVYKGMLDRVSVAVKILHQSGRDGEQQFEHEVEILSRIDHPHIVLLLGACNERKCIVYEYMANGSLEDRLMCKDGMSPLPWYVRFRICFEVATALIFLHNIAPDRIVHRDLKPGNILLDHNFVSKLSDAGLARWIPNSMTYDLTVFKETNPAGTFAYMDPEYLRTGSIGPHSDLFALGIVILQLLTGKRPVGVVELVEAARESDKLLEVLDQSAGDWPIPEAEELAKLGLQCAEPRRRDRPSEIFSILKRLNHCAQIAALDEANWTSFPEYHNDVVVPSFFICPLSQELMANPYVAADGFTYEYAAIKRWLAENDISPMTNLKLDNKHLEKDSSLYFAIQNWKEKVNAL